MGSATGRRMIERLAHRREGRRHARRDHAMSDHGHVAIRGLLPQRHRLVRPALQVRQRQIRCTSWRGSILPRRRDMRAPGAATGVYALECAMDELAVALKLDPLELRLRCYSDRDQHEDVPYTSKNLRECYRQGAEAFGWSKRSAEPRSMRDGSELVGWGMATGIWEALQMRMRRPHRADGQRPCRGRLRDLRHRHRHLHDHGAGGGRHARPAARQYHAQARRFDAAAIARRGRLMDGGLGIACDRDDGRRVRKELLRLAKTDAEFAARRREARTTSPSPTAAREQARRVARGVDRGCDAARRRRSHRAGECTTLQG